VKRKHRKWIEYLARAGLTGRGLVYLMVAAIAVQLPFGGSGSADREGALASISTQPWGTPLLIALAVCFAGYAAWRLVEAVLDPENKSKDPKGKWMRLGYLFRAGLYSSFAISTLRFTFTRRSEPSDQQTQETTAGVLGLPFGKWLVLGFGAGVVAVGLYNGYRAVSQNYRKDFKQQEMSRRECKTLFPLAAVGLTARAAVFLLIGGFLINAALSYDPGRAVGLDGALHRVAASPGGPLMLTAIAAGLAAFGIFSLAQARYRRIMNS